MWYQFQLQGELGDGWSAHFDGLTVEIARPGTTTLTGPVLDQAALFGILAKIRDLGLPLLAIRRIPVAPPASDTR